MYRVKRKDRTEENIAIMKRIKKIEGRMKKSHENQTKKEKNRITLKWKKQEEIVKE